MNISAAAVAVGVSPETLREWDQRIPALEIPRDTAGRRRFEERHVELLQTVKRLSEQGRSLESIRVILEPPAPQIMANVPVEVRPELMASAPVDVRPEAGQQWLRATLHAAHEAAATRAEALDDARKQIDQLQAEVQALRHRVADLAQENAQLRVSLENAEDRMQRAELINAVRQSTARPWWKLW